MDITLHANRLLSWLAAGTLVLFSAGCELPGQDVSGDSSGSTEVEADFEAEVLELIPPQGGEAGTIVVRSYEYDCFGGSLLTDTTVDESRYVISNGKLYIWEDGACHAEIVMTGSSSTIEGKWTATYDATPPLVPSAYRDFDCSDEDDEYDYEDYYDDGPDEADVEAALENVTVTYTISSTRIKGKMSGEICFAPLAAQSFENIPSVTVTSSSCGSAKLRNAETDRTATVTAAVKDDVLEYKFKSGDSTCVLNIPFDLSDKPPVCSEEDEEEDEQLMAFAYCLAGSGFMGDMGYEYEDYAAGQGISSAKPALAPDPAAGLMGALKKKLKSLSGERR